MEAYSSYRYRFIYDYSDKSKSFIVAVRSWFYCYMYIEHFDDGARFIVTKGGGSLY